MRLLGSPLQLTRSDISAKAGVSRLSARRFWHALGFPRVSTDVAAFTDADRQALHAAAEMVRDGKLDETSALSLTRAFARTTDRLSAWQVQLFAEEISRRHGHQPPIAAAGSHEDASLAQETAAAIIEMADRLEPLLVYAWRRHLTEALVRMFADHEAEAEEAGMHRAIGFADFVSFAAFVSRLTEREIADVAERFERVASDVITAHGARVIKTVGDEVLFASVLPVPAASVALDLVEALSDEEVLPDVRVGLGYGPVVPRLGDVFGTTVNRAARLTAIAQPGTVLVDGEFAGALANRYGFDVTPIRRRVLRGVGHVTPYVLERSTARGRRRRPS